METKPRKKYTAEFKRQTLELLTKGDKTQDDLEKDLGLSQGCIARWKRDLRNEGLVAYRGQGQIRPFDEEMERLRKEIQQVRAERDLLKKAMGIVSR